MALRRSELCAMTTDEQEEGS